MTRAPDDFSVEKPDIERNLRALLFEREAEIERLLAFIQGCSACKEEWERIDEEKDRQGLLR